VCSRGEEESIVKEQIEDRSHLGAEALLMDTEAMLKLIMARAVVANGKSFDIFFSFPDAGGSKVMDRRHPCFLAGCK
jgi:hypothetical protein